MGHFKQPHIFPVADEDPPLLVHGSKSFSHDRFSLGGQVVVDHIFLQANEGLCHLQQWKVSNFA